VSLLVVAVFLSPLLTVSCSDTDARQLGPSGLNTSALVEPTSSIVVATPVSNPFCPTVPPFTVAFGVNVNTGGSTDVTVTGIRFQFTDTAGVQSPQVTLPSPQVTLPAPGPTQTFGNPRGQSFPLVVGIGCGTGTTGTIVVFVDTVDDHGRTRSQRTMVTVR
jgi:hypothetical protein